MSTLFVPSTFALSILSSNLLLCLSAYIIPGMFFCFFCFLSFIECVCRACRIQYDDVSSHCLLLCLLQNNVVSLWLSFSDHITCGIEESARTLVVLGCPRVKKTAQCENTHTHTPVRIHLPHLTPQITTLTSSKFLRDNETISRGGIVNRT